MTEGEQFRYHNLIVEYVGKSGGRYVFETPKGVPVYLPFERLSKDLSKIL